MISRERAARKEETKPMSRVLIIEDEESIADLEKDYLELSGFEVTVENRGDTGLKAALEEDFDIIILDQIGRAHV